MKNEPLQDLNEQTGSHFERRIGLFGASALGAGLVIGVGLFTVATNAVGYLGPLLLVGNGFAFVVSLLTSLVYAELSAALPYSGGSYNYAFEAWGKKLGPFAGFMAAWIVIESLFFVGAEALAFANYFLSTLDFFGIWHSLIGGVIPFGPAAVVAIVLILVFTVLNWRGIKGVDRTQRIIMIVMWSFMFISTAVALIMYGDLSNYHPLVPEGFQFSMFLPAATLIWWAYAGQEVIGAMGEEIKFPTVNMPRALIIVPMIVFLVTVTLQWLVVGLIPDITILRDASAPFALALQVAGVGGVIFLMLMIAEFCGNFSTVNPVLTGASRTWFAMGRDGYLPTIIGKLNPKHNTPAFAIWFNSILVIVLLATKGLTFVASISSFSFLALYAFVSISHIALRITRPELKRPFKTPLYPVLNIVVIGFCVWMMFSLGKEVLIGGLSWLVLAAVVYLLWNKTSWGKKAKKEVTFFRSEATLPAEPTKEEKVVLDKEWHRMLLIIGVIAAVIFAMIAITYFMGA